jgi:hypothetical protein
MSGDPRSHARPLRRTACRADRARRLHQTGGRGSEHTGIPASHPLNADAGGPERRRGGLHPHAAHFVQHHDDVSGRHKHLFLDFLASQDFYPHRLILEPLLGTSGRHDRDGLLDGRLWLKVHQDVLSSAGCHLHRGRRRCEARLQHGDFNCAGDGVDGRCTGRVGPVGGAGHDYFCVFHGLFGGAHLNTNGRRLILGADRGRRTTDKHTDHQRKGAHTHLRGCFRTHQSIRLLNRSNDSKSPRNAEGGRVGPSARRVDG